MKPETQKNKNGFTLMEMIVALAVFMVAITIALAAFLNITDIQKKASAVRAVNDSLNFALETMSREIRTGFDYCSSFLTYTCVNQDEFAFTSGVAPNPEIVYRKNGDQIEVKVGGGSFSTLTPPEVKILTLKFNLQGEGSDDGQPMVTIIIEASSGTKTKTKSYLNIQTTITQRRIDSNK